MSRIGKKPVAIPAGVSANIADGVLSVKGPKGTLTLTLRDEISYVVEGDTILVKPANDTKAARAFWGMQRTLVSNLVTGVTEGYTKTLLITGVGYRATAQGKILKLQLGYSHDVNFDVPEGIEVKTPDNTTVHITGIDKQKVGQVAAEIRRWRKPEPYKGKGI
jgi:large subunit ribosomal protein L6